MRTWTSLCLLKIENKYSCLYVEELEPQLRISLYSLLTTRCKYHCMPVKLNSSLVKYFYSPRPRLCRGAANEESVSSLRSRGGLTDLDVQGRNQRGGRGGRGRGRGGGGGGGGWNSTPRQSFDEMPKQNKNMEAYYNALNIVPEGEEREHFWAALRRELPNSFRFCGSKG